MRAAGYVRVSTEEQVKHGWNLDEDKQRIQELANAEGWELIELWDDGGLRGDNPDRPGLRAMLDSLGQFDVLVMRSLDRLSRDLFIYAQVRNALRDAGVQGLGLQRADAVRPHDEHPRRDCGGGESSDQPARQASDEGTHQGRAEVGRDGSVWLCVAPEGDRGDAGAGEGGPANLDRLRERRQPA
jgi:hypothetical protein